MTANIVANLAELEIARLLLEGILELFEGEEKHQERPQEQVDAPTLTCSSFGNEHEHYIAEVQDAA